MPKHPKHSVVLCTVLFTALHACGDNTTSTSTATATDTATAIALQVTRAQVLSDEALVNLGRDLFWDPILSGTQTVACASCHHPSRAYADGRSRAIGVNGRGLGPARRDQRFFPQISISRRNTPTILNTAHNGDQSITDSTETSAEDGPMFWDNRETGLAAQALHPLRSESEMRGPNWSETDIDNEISRRLSAIPDYQTQFDTVFGADTEVDILHIATALSAFQSTLTNLDTPFDRYRAGDENALTVQQRRGLQAFNAVGCANCHSGTMLSDFRPHILGIAPTPGIDDRGNGQYAFRTPSLRNVALTAPYMHNGSIATLREAIAFYDRPNSRHPAISNRNLDPEVRGMRVNRQEQADILAFLQTLHSRSFDQTVPQQVPSGLMPGGDIAN